MVGRPSTDAPPQKGFIRAARPRLGVADAADSMAFNAEVADTTRSPYFTKAHPSGSWNVASPTPISVSGKRANVSADASPA